MGSAFALGPDDFVFPTFRELAAALVRGVDPVQYLAYHRGTWHGGPYDPRATRFGPICIPVATQIVARRRLRDGPAARRRRGLLAWPTSATAARARATSTKRRTWRACSGRRRSCSARTTGGRSACRPRSRPRVRSGSARRRYGFPGVRVDGNDVLAVYRVTREARRRARCRATGPTLIEALTYRIGAHTTADDAGRYRDEDEVEAARANDPIARYRDVAARVRPRRRGVRRRAARRRRRSGSRRSGPA